MIQSMFQRPARQALRAFVALLAAGLVSGSAYANGRSHRGAEFPPGFLWGTAISGLQTEMGGAPAHSDPNSDWFVWLHDPANISSHLVSGDEPEAGPAFYDLFAEDIAITRHQLDTNAFRLSIEWSRIFPHSTAAVDISRGITLDTLHQLDALADQAEVEHYRAVLTAIRAQHMKPFVTINHFTLPLWLHDPIAARDALAGVDPNGPLPTGFGSAGWLDARIVPEFAKYAAYLGWKFGNLVDFWVPLNEPVVTAVDGYLNIPPGVVPGPAGQNGNFPPGAFTFIGVRTVLLNEMKAQAAAYDALKDWDACDIDGDGEPAQVGLVGNFPAFHPSDPANPADQFGAAHADYLFNRMFLNAVIYGDVDANGNGEIDEGEHDEALAGKVDFIGVNYYQRARVTGLGAPVTPVFQILDFAVTINFRSSRNPEAPPCPSVCSDIGWEIYPEGLAEVLGELQEYELPIYITENGIADAEDDERPAYLIQHLQVLQEAIEEGADVRGYFHWSLMDNLELTDGYFPKFGLFAVEPGTHRLRARPSARYFRRIAEENAIPWALLRRFGR